MGWALKLCSISRRLKALVRRGGLPRTPLVGQTLEREDARLAGRLLRDPTSCGLGEVAEFENAFARWLGSRYAFAFDSCRGALYAVLRSLGLKDCEKVAVPGYTCVAVYNAVRFAGLRPVFADIELDSFGVDAQSFRRLVKSGVRVLILHHLYGLVARDLEELVSLAKDHEITVIEDCAQSAGAKLGGRAVGTFGDFGVFSSEMSKVFCTVRGGVAVTDDPLLAERLREEWVRAPVVPSSVVRRQLRHVRYLYYRYKSRWRAILGGYLDWRLRETLLPALDAMELGGTRPALFGARMPGAVAVLALHQLGKVDSYNRKRRQWAKTWDTWCDAHGFRRPLVIPGSEPVFLRYPVLVDPEMKEDTRWAERELGVTLGVWFKTNLHPIPGTIPECPAANEAVRRCVNFPTLL